jgi:hypothetical protein
MSKYSTKCWGETYTIRADFSRPESSVEVLGDDGEWCGTQYQVAAYSTPRQAMQAVLLDSLEASGGDYEDSESDIKAAVANVKAD